MTISGCGPEVPLLEVRTLLMAPGDSPWPSGVVSFSLQRTPVPSLGTQNAQMRRQLLNDHFLAVSWVPAHEACAVQREALVPVSLKAHGCPSALMLFGVATASRVF